MVKITILKLKNGKSPLQEEFKIPLKEGMNYIYKYGYIIGIVCDVDIYNKSYQTCRKHMRKIINTIDTNERAYWENNYNEYLKAMEEEENKEDPLGLRYVF
jgi:hypothetical protein